MNILADQRLPDLDFLFPKPFVITRYEHQAEIPQLIPDQEILLCRSTLAVNAALLERSSIRAVGTASSGIDHVDQAYLERRGIPLFDAKGCNARAVADYVASTLAYLMTTHHIKPQKTGVIGMGHVGSAVSQRFQAAGIEVIGYDPLKAIHEPTFKSCTLDELWACDVLCIHANLHDSPPVPSINLVNQPFLSQLKPNTVIINAARGNIVDESALLSLPFPLIYCTDVYANEPSIDPRIVNYATLCTPHIAGHSIEAKSYAVELIRDQLMRYFFADIPRPPPIHPATTSIHLPNHHSTWQKTLLAIYNPAIETQQLQAAEDLQSSFFQLRQQHHFRHDFKHYYLKKIDKKIELLLGK